MKLLVQADDYAMSPAVARGIIHGIEHGLIRNTGAFANSPWFAECMGWLAPFADRVDVGIDLNITTGAPLSDPRAIPSLVREDGSFHTSRESRELDAAVGGEHVVPAEAIREFRAQVERFRAVTGNLPAYVHSHAYTTPGIVSAQRAVAAEYGIPFASDVWRAAAGVEVTAYRIPWYVKPATLENQAASLLADYVLAHADELAAQPFVLLAGHMGYIDRELMEQSSYTLLRANDLAGVCDPRVIAWAEAVGAELFRYSGRAAGFPPVCG